MNAEEKRAEIEGLKVELRLMAETTITVIENFLGKDRDRLGLTQDNKFIEWLKEHIKDYKDKKEKTIATFERKFPNG